MDAEDFTLSDFLPYRLAVLSERVSKRLAQVYEQSHGLSIPEWRVIAHLAHGEKVSVREIHRSANLEKPRVSRAVARLEAAGLVEKTGNAADQRLVEISLTGQGRRVLREIVPEALAVEAGLLDGFTPEETRLLVSLIEKLHRRLDRDSQAARRSPDPAGSAPPSP